jgi:hypothetical protein
MLIPDMERFLDGSSRGSIFLYVDDIQWSSSFCSSKDRNQCHELIHTSQRGKDVVDVNGCAAEGAQLRSVEQDEFWRTFAADIVSTGTKYEGMT